MVGHPERLRNLPGSAVRPDSERLGVIRPVDGKYGKLEALGPPLDR